MDTFVHVILPIVAVVVFVLVVRWALRWRDPNFSSREKQSEANLWSKRRSGPGR